MPAKKNPLSAEDQRKRFEAEVRRLVDAGELSPTDADAALERLVKKQGNQAGR
jgi:lipase chaperone LimK